MPSAYGIAAALLASTVALSSAATLAQTSAPPAAAQSAQAAAVSDQDLRRFAEATARIRIIDREYTKKKDGKSEAERATLTAAENKENLAAVEGAGLTVAQYNAISKAIQDDPALAKKAYEYIYAVPVR